MRAVIQRVKEARVIINSEVVGKISKGILIFIGIEKGDEKDDADYILSKIINLRIFEDEQGKMNLSVLDVKESLLIVSQFTLLGDCRKGRRPSFDNAEIPQRAEGLYNYFIGRAKESSLHIEKGEFQKEMEVQLINDGPVTFILDSKPR